ncbi:MAG TPA: YceI family protein [Herpetosiphonaceae bacterium]|nr:YceI family protein [Herpetosiphonaceae bacterium]
MANLKKIVGAGIVVVALIAAVVAYSVFKTPAQASAPIEAVPLAATSAGASTSTASAEVTPDAADAASTAETAASADPTATAEVAATDQPASASAPETTETAAASSSGAVLAQIVPEESEVRFLIDEVLNGAPKTVVGTTNQVAGEISVDPNDPSQTRVGVIQVNARTLATDSGMRNRTIANRILQTGQYEFITFTPTSIVGLPEQGAIGHSNSHFADNSFRKSCTDRIFGRRKQSAPHTNARLPLEFC